MNQYRGLVNEGSTCYLNSLLQTLFMTPQFRKNVYNYVHDERKISAANSIPYQLQKLFVLLQLNQTNVYTKGLLKSFQWTEVDSFQQHDVQQFCRVLFQALQKASKGKGQNWIQNLYSGIMQSFISCGKHPRSNQQMFMDISLPIRSQYQKKNYQSIQECLKQYLRPQNLQDKINCQGCGQKVNVEKGMRLTNLPSILTLQINRFQLNYQNMQRQKVNSFLYFPEILQMWRFMVPFQQIELKGLPKDLFNKVKLLQKQKSSRATDFGYGGLVITGKKIERKKSFQIQAQKKKTKFYDEQNRDKRQDETKQLSAEQQKMKNIQILKDLKAEKEKLDKFGKKSAQDKKNSKQKQTQEANKEIKKQNQNQGKQQTNQKTKQEKEKKKIVPPPPSYSIDDDMLFGSFMDGFDRTQGTNLNQFQSIDISVTNDNKKTPKFQKTEPVFQHEQQSFDPQKQYPQNTYILYSILVHSGGAYGGHYYAYIFNGFDWYCFNDNSVKKVSKEEIRKYGHPLQDSSYGANAYLLFYRQVHTFKTLVKQSLQIPSQLLEKVLADKTPIQQPKTSTSAQYRNRLSQIQNSLILKIKYKNKQLETLMIGNRYEQTIASMKKLIKQNLKIQHDDSNWRMRRYNKSQDSMHQVYDVEGNLEKSLEQIGLRQTAYIAIQVKNQDQEFQDYDPRNIVVKLNVWRQDLTLLTQTHLKPVKLWVRQQTKFEDFYKKVSNALHIKDPVIIKRNFSVGNPYHLFQLEPNKDRTLISLKFFNGINLYVQQRTSEKLKWQKQFQDEKYKCQIKFNNPRQGQEKNFQIFIDTRKTLLELKQRISEIIAIPIELFRIKKSQQAVSEMTMFKKRLIDLKFVNVQYLYIEEGRSSKGTVIIRKGVVELIEDQISYILGEEYQVQIQENVSSVADLKVKIGEKYGLAPFLVRVRQFKAQQFGQIIRDSQTLLKIREKSLIWQQLQIQDPKGLQIYLRLFDLLTLQLGPLLTIFVQSSGNYQQLALLICQQTQIQENKILVHKLPSNFIDKSLLFQVQWYEIRYINKPIRQDPLFLVNDGDILIVKAAQTSYHPKIGERVAGQNSVAESGQYNKSKKKEAALKITVVQQKQIETTKQQIKQKQKQQNMEDNNNDKQIIVNENVLQKTTNSISEVEKNKEDGELV